MDTAKVFEYGNGQAIELPEGYRFHESEVFVNRVGDVVMLYPKSKGWDILESSLEKFTEDFMESRD